jgi:hypothetical protein
MLNKYDRLKYRRGIYDSLFTGRLLGRSRRLKRLIANYPVYSPPNPGESQRLSEMEATQNFEYFEQEKSNRINIIENLLGEFEVFIDCKNPSVDGLMSMDAWAYQQWEGIYIPQLVKTNIYDFPVTGEVAHVRSLLFDTSVLLAECYLSQSISSEWYLDVGRQSQDQEMTSFNRVIIKNRSKDLPEIIDMEAQVFLHYSLQKKSLSVIESDQKIGRTLAEPVIDLLQC